MRLSWMANGKPISIDFSPQPEESLLAATAAEL
jgi:hypothetical protein